MHDPTEGGLALGLHELAEASGVGFEITEEQIPILGPVDKVTTLLDVDPLSLLSSGALVATVDSDYEENALSLLDPLGIQVNVIGRLTDDPNRMILRRDGTRESLAKPSADEIWRFVDSTPT
jgi:hydrogenase maturation factor